MIRLYRRDRAFFLGIVELLAHLALADDARHPGHEGRDVGEVGEGGLARAAHRHDAAQEPGAVRVREG